MKRTLAAFAALLLAASAHAAPSGKLLIVTPEIVNAAESFDADIAAAYRNQARVDYITRQVCDKLGVNYTFVKRNNMRTRDVKYATMPHGFPGAIRREEQFDAVLMLTNVLNATPTTSGGGNQGYVALPSGGLRCDSTLNTSQLAAKSGDSQAGFLKPVGYLFTKTTKIVNGAEFWSQSACTTGVTTEAEATSMMHAASSPTRGFWTGGNYQALAVKDSRTPKGGLRKLITATASALTTYPECNNVLPVWSDSMYATAASDTLVAWEINWGSLSTLTGSARAVFAILGVQNGKNDSLTATAVPAEGDAQIVAYMLARLDSLSGGILIDKAKLPIRLGVTVDAGTMYNATRGGPGILPSDSTVFKATLDSIRVANAAGGVPIKLTVGVDPESLLVRPNFLTWWRKLSGNVRFSPQSWCGVLRPKTSTAGDGDVDIEGAETTYPHLVDVFGFRRARTFMGPSKDSVATGRWSADSSMYWQILRQRDNMARVGVRREEFSKTALPPLDDWVRSNASTASEVDSLFYVLKNVGFTTIRADGRSHAGSMSNSRNAVAASAMTPWGIASTGALGYVNRPGYYQTPIAGSFKVLTHNGYPITGSRKWFVTFGADTSRSTFTTPCIPDSGYINMAFEENARTWSGLFYSEDMNSDWIPPGPPSTPGPKGDINHISDNPRFYSFYAEVKDNTWANVDREVPIRPAAIRKFNAADFAGASNGPPARLAWHLLKTTKNGMDAINTAAGRTIIEFAYPEDIKP